MGISNEVVLEICKLILVFIVLIFIFVDFGFDIKELVATFTAAFPSMTLYRMLAD